MQSASVMNVLIIEDEPLAAQRLELLLKECDPDIKVIDVLDSVKASVEWFKINDHPPLIMMDVHLGDGLCFEIFKQVKVSSFIIFTTAYDQYALQAFKVNSIDYLLKPVSKDMLCESLSKFETYNKEEVSQSSISKLLAAVQVANKDYKERFVVKVGAHIRMINTEDISCFYSLEKATYLVTKEGNTYLIDFTLEGLLDVINPGGFFRISRKYIASLKYIRDVISTGPSRMKIKVAGYQEEEMVVSRDRIKPFKFWLEG